MWQWTKLGPTLNQSDSQLILVDKSHLIKPPKTKQSAGKKIVFIFEDAQGLIFIDYLEKKKQSTANIILGYWSQIWPPATITLLPPEQEIWFQLKSHRRNRPILRLKIKSFYTKGIYLLLVSSRTKICRTPK